MAAKVEPTEQSAGSDDELNQQLHAIIVDLQRAGLQPNHPEEDEPVERNDLGLGIAPHLDHEALERNAIYDRLGAIENQKKERRSSRGFARYLTAICIGVAATLAWQAYGDAAKQVIATRAPELGWSPEAKREIASWTVGWIKPQASPEKIAPEPVASSKAPPAPSGDAAQVQQIAQNLTALRETVEQIAASQDQTSREMARVESVLAELILKFPEPSAQSPAAPEHKPVPPSLRAPTAPTSRH